MTPEEAKSARKEAYRKAKAARENSPSYQALKEKKREYERARYRTFVAKKKAQAQEKKTIKKSIDEAKLRETFIENAALKLIKFE